jgi:20S proteasome alpha/beta subunit
MLLQCVVGNMTLSIIVGGPDGLVFATESRTIAVPPLSDGSKAQIYFDSTNKLLTFNKPHNFVAAVTYGRGELDNRAVSSFMPEFETKLTSKKRLSIKQYAKELASFFSKQWNKIPELEGYTGESITFLVGGFNKDELTGRIYQIDIPDNLDPTELPATGIRCGGQSELVERLIRGYDPTLPRGLARAWLLTDEEVKSVPEIAEPLKLVFPIKALGLQGCVDVAILLMRTTIETQRLTACIRGCGGPIDVATITQRDGLRYVQRKQIKGESTSLSKNCRNLIISDVLARSLANNAANNCCKNALCTFGWRSNRSS